eukprot:6195445-Pleurochrysis_carterae.AAC.1
MLDPHSTSSSAPKAVCRALLVKGTLFLTWGPCSPHTPGARRCLSWRSSSLSLSLRVLRAAAPAAPARRGAAIIVTTAARRANGIQVPVPSVPVWVQIAGFRGTY